MEFIKENYLICREVSLVNKHLAKDDIINMKKSSHRKYLDWRIIYFGLTKKEYKDQVDLESVLVNQEKDVEEDYVRSDRKECRKKMQYKSNTEAELDFLLKRGELSLDILIIQKDLTLTELMKKEILIIESTRLLVKNDGKFIMYQTINILLVHKRKQ
uniref:Uncharacterized protein n=2 Tax=Populus trichocarpa TaxID=3694 RepID=A0A2K1Y2J3_POPTR